MSAQQPLPIIFPTAFLTSLRTAISKFLWKVKTPHIKLSQLTFPKLKRGDGTPWPREIFLGFTSEQASRVAHVFRYKKLDRIRTNSVSLPSAPDPMDSGRLFYLGGLFPTPSCRPLCPYFAELTTFSLTTPSEPSHTHEMKPWFPPGMHKTSLSKQWSSSVPSAKGLFSRWYHQDPTGHTKINLGRANSIMGVFSNRLLFTVPQTYFRLLQITNPFWGHVRLAYPSQTPDLYIIQLIFSKLLNEHS